MIKIVICIIISIVNISKCTNAICSTESAKDPGYPYKFYNDITLYDTVRGNITQDVRPPGCSPMHIVMVARHGSRHPGINSEDIYQSLFELKKKLNSTGDAKMCSYDLQKIRKWNNWHQPELDLDLATTGYKEMYGLADRFSHTFPELFTNENLDAASYRFVSSSPKRVKESAHAFIDKLFRNSGEPQPEVQINDKLIRSWAFCKKWADEVRNNATVYEEGNKFFEGPYVTGVADRFANRLGLPRDEVTNKLVKNVWWYGCAHEEWANGNDSAWCLPFRKEDSEIFEYYEDIRDYNRKSYANEINYKPSCMLKHFVLSALENAAVNGTTLPLGHFVFGHAPTITALLTEMKIIPDGGALKSGEFLKNMNRSFRGSLYEPGAANVLFVLYSCGDKHEKKVQIFLNEKLVPMPLKNPAPDGLWNLDQALKYFDYYSPNTCDYEKMCSVNGGITYMPNDILLFIMVLGMFKHLFFLYID